MSEPATVPTHRDADQRRRRFEQLHADHAARVFAYARRRSSRMDADEVVAETFLVAWRRLDDIPDAALPWLLAVARRTLANQRRGSDRQERLRLRLASVPAAGAAADAEQVSDVVRRALDQLPAAEREALTLLVWDELTPAEVATVLDCSRAAVYLRLHRARRRLADLLPEGLRHD